MGWFGSEPFVDARLGTFRRANGAWVGALALGEHDVVELCLAGDRKAPAAPGLALAGEVAAQYAQLRDAIARALVEHLEPYASDGEMLANDFDPATVRGPQDVWAHVQATRVDVDASRTAFPIEVQLRVAWDDEHTLGVRLREGRLVELCGSV